METGTETHKPRTYRCDACGWDSSADPEFCEAGFRGCCPHCRKLLSAEALGRRFAGFSDEELAEMYSQLNSLSAGVYMPVERERLALEVFAEQELRRARRLQKELG